MQKVLYIQVPILNCWRQFCKQGMWLAFWILCPESGLISLWKKSGNLYLSVVKKEYIAPEVTESKQICFWRNKPMRSHCFGRLWTAASSCPPTIQRRRLFLYSPNLSVLIQYDGTDIMPVPAYPLIGLMASASSFLKGSHHIGNLTTGMAMLWEAHPSYTEWENGHIDKEWVNKYMRSLLGSSSQCSHQLRPREWETSANGKNQGSNQLVK